MPPARLLAACNRLPPALRQQHHLLLHPHPHPSRNHSLFSTTVLQSKKQIPLPPRPTVPPDQTHKKFLKGSGPGGQKINKTNSAVQLTHIATGMVVKSQATRSRTANERIARRIMGEKLEFIEKGEGSRVAMKVERMARRKASAGKKRRRKYRRLAENNEKEQGEEEMEDEEDMEVLEEEETVISEEEKRVAGHGTT